MNKAKSRIYQLLGGSWREVAAGKAINYFLVYLIFFNVLAVIFESVEGIGSKHARYFEIFEIFVVAVFTVEYALRLWSCTENPRHRSARPLAGRSHYALSLMGIVDFLAIAPFYLSILIPVDIRVLLVFRLLRLLKLARYSPAMETLGTVLYNERRALFSALMCMLVLLVFASSLMHVIEHRVQPAAFGSIPASMWWAVVTLTTVGYGDIAPITPLGKLLGGIVTILGIGTFALPAGILASGFAQEIKKRDFIVQWNVVARVPLFGSLNAEQIAEIAKLLRPRITIPGEVITQKDEIGDAMYLISSGRVEVVLEPEPVELKGGEFFGEIALIRRTPRTADVIALTSCQLLVLRAEDFFDLMEQNPKIRESVQRVAEERVKMLDQSAPPVAEVPDEAP